MLAAWSWATAHAPDVGASPDALHIGGASAGGNRRSRKLRAALAARNDGTEVGTIGDTMLREICLQYAGSVDALSDR